MKYALTILLTNCAILLSAQLKIGDRIPNISLQNNLNQEIKLSSNKGKLLLLDYWASWCAPCRKSNKKMVKLHQKLNGEKFEIIGISVDTNKEKWLNAISKDKLPYKQLIDPKGFEAKSVEVFGVEILPTTFLISSGGILLAINPSQKEIKSYLK